MKTKKCEIIYISLNTFFCSIKHPGKWGWWHAFINVILYFAGTAPLVPYLSTYARQLGFSPATVGLIYTILPVFGLIAKPLFGIIADRYINKPH